ncbi:hypothetical protein BH11PSE1_BH11PSE1_09680 [soil metagenome]
MQGIENIEVTRPRAKIHEAWAQQAFGRVSVRAGLDALNSEFYTTDAAGRPDPALVLALRVSIDL